MPLSTSLISSWEMTEASGNRADSHGTNTLTDNNTVGSGTGLVYGTVADFESSNSEYLSCASNPSLQAGDIDFTIEAWIKLESSGQYSVVTKDDDAANSRDYTLFYEGGVGPRFHIFGSGGITLVSWGADLSTGTWYHLLAWHDAAANEIGICVNAGTPVTAGTGGNVPDVSSAQFRIGAREYSGFEWYFDGLIGPVRFWKRVLTGAERTELYNAGAGRTYAYITGGGGPTYTLTADVGTFTLTGNAAGLTAGRVLTAATGSFTLTGNSAGLTSSRLLTAATGSFTLTGNDTGLTVGRALTAATGAFTLTGNDAGLTASRLLTAGTGAFTLTGNDATLTYTPAGITYTLTAGSGAFTLTGVAAGLTVSRVLTAAAGTFTLTGSAAALTYSGAPVATPTGRRCATWAEPNRTATWEEPSRTARWYDDLCTC